jgi:hypothetical protein
MEEERPGVGSSLLRAVAGGFYSSKKKIREREDTFSSFLSLFLFFLSPARELAQQYLPSRDRTQIHFLEQPITSCLEIFCQFEVKLSLNCARSQQQRAVLPGSHQNKAKHDATCDESYEEACMSMICPKLTST